MQAHRPVVAIVGRPNVGKSAVFNRLAGRRVSIVHDLPGVTRDRIAAAAGTVRVPLTVMDTGGIGESIDDGIAAQVEIEADVAIEEADLILFVVDARTGLTPVDQAVADRLRRKRAPVWLAVNKVDGVEHEPQALEFSRLGFGDMIMLSATTGRGFPELRQQLETRFPAGPAPVEVEEPDGVLRIAVIGRPNVGKSSLVNAILDNRRTIVNATAGTTRDAIDIPFEKDGRSFLLIDTAGLRRRTRVDTSVEAFSVQRAKESVRRADLCILVIDAAAGATMQERKIAQFILGENKPCLLVFNKFDLFHPDARLSDRRNELLDSARREFFFMPYAPIIAVSALHRLQLGRIFSEVGKIRAGAQEAPGTGVLNRLIQRAFERHPPPAVKGRRLRLLYATLARHHHQRPIEAPVIVCFVNHPDLLSADYQRYLETQLRREYPFHGLPIRFDIRARAGSPERATPVEHSRSRKRPEMNRPKRRSRKR